VEACAASLRWVRELGLAGNLLTRPPSLSPLPKLLRLDLSHNPLLKSLWPPGLPPTLRDLNVEGGGLTTLVSPEGQTLLQALPELRTLNVAHNAFADAEAALAPLQQQGGGSSGPPRLTSLTVAPSPFCTSDPRYAEVLLRTVRALGCLQRLNGREYKPGLAASADAWAEAVARSIEVSERVGGGESCSCVAGNPCAVPDNCKDWPRRFEVARAAREESYARVF
jgi:hypothetical protein